MEKSKLNLVHTNRVEMHNGQWMGVWEGICTVPIRDNKERNVRVYIMMIQDIEEPRLKHDGEI